MKSYLAVLLGTFSVLLIAMWVIFLMFFGKMASGEYAIAKAHADFIAKCDLGDIDILGDSTANAAFIPSQIGPQVRNLSFGAGTPIELYYVAKSILKCPNRPKAVILAFVPSSFATNSFYPELGRTFFWERAIEYNVVSFSDSLEVLKYSRQFNDTLIAGPKSLFDIDYRVKAFLFCLKFPPYLLPEVQKSALPKLQALAAAQLRRIPGLGPKHVTAPGQKQAEQASLPGPLPTGPMMYNQTILDNGHHFYGTDSNGGDRLDHDAYRNDDHTAPLKDFYMRRTIAMLSANGIKVFLVEPPRDRSSAVHYTPALINGYQAYLAGLQSSTPYVHLISQGFPIWDPVLFGDNLHLNLRGSLNFSAGIREALVAAGLVDPGYSESLTPANLYAHASSDPNSWVMQASGTDEISQAADVVLPQLAFPPDAEAWLYSTKSQGANAAPAPSGVRAPPVKLVAKMNYAASILVKNVNADQASLQLVWPGGFEGKVSWSFERHQITYAGMATSLNSGVTICPGGWVELFLSGRSGPSTGSYSGPAVSLTDPQNASAYLYNLSLEPGLWPTNYCPLQPGEAKTVNIAG